VIQTHHKRPSRSKISLSFTTSTQFNSKETPGLNQNYQRITSYKPITKENQHSQYPFLKKPINSIKNENFKQKTKMGH